MWFYSNFDQEHSLDGEFKSASNEYPLGILLVPRSLKNKKYMKKHDADIIITFFSWRGVHQKYVKWVLVGCGIEFSIQQVLLIEIWVKPDEDKFKIRVEKIVYFSFC